MIKVEIDNNGYWTGNYIDMPNTKKVVESTEVLDEEGNVISYEDVERETEIPITDFEGSQEVDEIPDEEDELRKKAYKIEDKVLIFDQSKYDELKIEKDKNIRLYELREEIKGYEKLMNDLEKKITKCSNYSLLGLELPYAPSDLLKQKNEYQAEIDVLNEEIQKG